MQTQIGTYKVGIEADDLAGWDQESLADALAEPLAELGFRVEVVRNSTVLNAIEINDVHPGAGDDYQIREQIRAVVSRVIEG